MSGQQFIILKESVINKIIIIVYLQFRFLLKHIMQQNKRV